MQNEKSQLVDPSQNFRLEFDPPMALRDNGDVHDVTDGVLK